jgi:asparagine synthase (glutamine-hydrolysing)
MVLDKSPFRPANPLMCGIAGIISRENLDQELVRQAEGMLASMLHRGPDGKGVYSEPNVFLGMRRLSIIDLQGGWQPIYNEDRSVVLVANGEIYNFVELRQQLEQAGHVFKTGSDCETIVHLYEDHGTECLKYLRGMFAFALWDLKKKRLFIARDRIGEKPLYLCERPGQIFFASELQALVRSGIVPLEPDPAAIDLFFHFQYVPEPGTILKGVRKLPAGCFLLVDLPGWRIAEQRYWSLDAAPALSGDPVALIRAQLDEIGKLIIRSDVPVGVALSGGLDSSLIAALAVRHSPRKLQAFCVGYADRPESDERAAARQFADFLGMPVQEVVLSVEELVDSFPGLVLAADDPIADIAGFGYFSVMRAARQAGVPVMLQGQGGDELFWGYEWVRRAVRMSRLKARLLAEGAGAWPAYWRAEFPERWDFHGIRRWLKKIAGIQPALGNVLAHRRQSYEQFVFYDLTPEFKTAQRLTPRLYSPAFRAQLPPTSPASVFTQKEGWNNVEVAITKLICDTYLSENGIAQGDRLSMASSVELRLPLIDYRLVETVIGLRKQTPDSAALPKSLLRQAAATLLPDWLMQRPKRGFAPPVQAWRQQLEKKYGDALPRGFLVEHGIVSHDEVVRLLREADSDGAVANFRFQLLLLELWFQGMGRNRQAT